MKAKLSAMHRPQAPLLKNWSVCQTPDPYLAPECRSSHLQGHVYEHPGFDDGTPVLTSAISGKANGYVITKSGSRYELGQVDPAYAALYPAAEQRLFNSLPEIQQ